jgi:hypothetical protein
VRKRTKEQKIELIVSRITKGSAFMLTHEEYIKNRDRVASEVTLRYKNAEDADEYYKDFLY